MNDYAQRKFLPHRQADIGTPKIFFALRQTGVDTQRRFFAVQQPPVDALRIFLALRRADVVTERIILTGFLRRDVACNVSLMIGMPHLYDEWWYETFLETLHATSLQGFPYLWGYRLYNRKYAGIHWNYTIGR